MVFKIFLLFKKFFIETFLSLFLFLNLIISFLSGPSPYILKDICFKAFFLAY